MYAMTGSSSAASTPQSPKASAAETVQVKTSVGKGAGKVVQVKASLAKVVQIGSAGAKQPGVAAPDGTTGTSGPNSECMAYYDYSASGVPVGGYAEVEFSFSFSPFVVGSMFNQTVQTRDAVESVYQSGDNVYVSVENNFSAAQNFAGFYGVLYNPNDGGC
jgi:hypothetical protein